MKILIMTHHLAPYTDATSSIVYRIAGEMHRRYGVEICMLGLKTAEESSSEYPSWYLTDMYHYSKTIPSTLPKLEKGLRLLTHPDCWSYRFRIALKDQFGTHRDEYKRVLKRALQELPDIDAVLCSIAPLEAAYAVMDAELKVPLFIWKLDPWGTHYELCGDPRYLRDEEQADARCAGVFVTPRIYQDYQNGLYRTPIEKVISVDFPCLYKHEIKQEISYGEGIHCAYVGLLYSNDLRSPNFLFELFRKMEGTGIILHIIGNTPWEEQLYRPTLPSNVILHGRLPKEEADAYTAAADILVNMGNSIENQLPSKTIEYLSYGKPILNLSCIENCPTIPYMKRYPLSLCVRESEGLTEETVGRVRDFCRENKGQKVPFERMRELYPTCTPEYVNRQIYEAFCKTTEGN